MVHLVRVEYINFLYENQILHVTDVTKSKFCMLPNSSSVLYCQMCITKNVILFVTALINAKP